MPTDHTTTTALSATLPSAGLALPALGGQPHNGATCERE